MLPPVLRVQQKPEQVDPAPVFVVLKCDANSERLIEKPVTW